MTDGVAFPQSDGQASTTALGRAVLADAAAAIDPELGRRIAAEQDWRRMYGRHHHATVLACVPDSSAARAVADAGLTAVHRRMLFRRAGTDIPLKDATQRAPVPKPLGTMTVQGEAARQRELAIPYRGQLLRGDALARQLDRWVSRGIVEPGCATAVRLVAAHPEWLALPGRRVAILGAAAEMAPLVPLSQWGAEVLPVDLPRPDLWRRILTSIRRGAGRAQVPAPSDAGDTGGDLAASAGADISLQLPEVGAWLADATGPLTVAGYAYAHGAAHVRANAAVDAVVGGLLAARDDVSVASLATPTDVFAVPLEAVAHSRQRYASATNRLTVRAVRRLGRGRLLMPNYPTTIRRHDGREVGVVDCVIEQQGPSYALAKQVQRWRAVSARSNGRLVSMRVAPTTRTKSVMGNRALAAAYAGGPRFGLEAFDPETSSTLMAALLVHDLCNPEATAHPSKPLAHPFDLLMDGAAHSGLWRTAYAPRSVLPLAVALGAPAMIRPVPSLRAAR